MTNIPWLGEVRFPVTAVKRAFDVTLGKMLQTTPTSESDTEVPYFKSASIQWEGVNADADVRMWATLSERRELAVQRGDLLICEGGDVGRAAIYDGPEGYIFQNSVHRARPTGASDIRFLGFVLRALHGSDWLDVLCNKATIRHLTGDKLGALQIPLPPLDEQRRVATFLDAETARIDRLTSATERQQKLVTERQLVAFHDSVKSEGGPDLNVIEPAITNSDWHMLPLNHALNQLTNGYVGATRELFVDDGVRYLQSLHIKNGRIDFARKPYFVKQEWAEERPRIRLGFEDILIVQTGAIGEVGLVDDEHVGASCHALLIARTKRSILTPRYLWHAFRSHWGRNALLREQTGALHPHLEAGNVRFMKIPLPDLDTQRRVVARTEEIARDTVTIERALSRRLMLQSERRQALITAAVTGQFDVTTASGRNVTDGVTA
ncbi:restriction endonuclease subunit S [Streptomyces sp. NPDC013978]|uniref:restriction endonuclease subunit S n=1 Tax=Streptomyces sp. NPDC013978 TaxID=3364869 RepID=UPI0036F5F8AA